VIGLAACALLACAGAAYAIGTAVTTTVIHGCAKTAAPSTLSLRTAGTCPAGTTALSWNKRGPQGIQGVQGVQGIQGVPGDPGSPGLSGFQTVTAVDDVPAANIGTVDVPCPSGQTAISGGWSVPYTATVLESHPSPVGPSVWRTAAAFPGNGGTLKVTVQCATVAGASAAARSRARTASPTVTTHFHREGATQ
jgi:hypothetical protein